MLIRFVDAHRRRRPEDKAVLLCRRSNLMMLTHLVSRSIRPLVIVPGSGFERGIHSRRGTVAAGDLRREMAPIPSADSGRSPNVRTQAGPLFQSQVTDTATYAGRANVVWWEAEVGELREWQIGLMRASEETQAWGHKGIAVSQMRRCALHAVYEGELFDNSSAVIVPRNVSDLPASMGVTYESRTSDSNFVA